MYTPEQITCAVDDAVALIHEFDGACLTDRLAVFGVPRDALAATIQERWARYAHLYAGEPPEVVFAAAFTEAFLAGTRLEAERVA